MLADLVARFVVRIRRRVAQLEAPKINADDPVKLIAEYCTIGNVQHMAAGFHRHHVEPAAALRTLAGVAERGGTELLRSCEFITPESATLWDSADRLWLANLSRAFDGKTVNHGE